MSYVKVLQDFTVSDLQFMHKALAIKATYNRQKQAMDKLIARGNVLFDVCYKVRLVYFALTTVFVRVPGCVVSDG